MIDDEEFLAWFFARHPEQYHTEEIKDSTLRNEIKHGWHYFFNDKAWHNKKAIQTETKNKFHGNIGKYMFFGRDKEKLISLGERILLKFNLYTFKLPTNLTEGYTDFVLCIYDIGKTFEKTLKDYETPDIIYRGWKSDKQTIMGK